ncbi:MAG: type I pullulanase [Lachnospiraceae bacterium]|nr:type I pullulanase [Lachnospiraceae bacterium]
MKENTIYLTKEFEEKYTYTGNDLGSIYSKNSTAFRVYAPTAESVVLNLYKDGSKGTPFEKIEMKQAENGTYTTVVSGDLNKVYYTYEVKVNGKTKEAVDPYAKAAGVNGLRGMVVDLKATNPEGFEQEVRPEKVNPEDAVLYELHIRDFSIDESSGMKNKGKYTAFIEENTVNGDKLKTGIEHMKELGITHVHLLPSFDYGSVDESKLEVPQYNWGYDPVNYNVPEGSYSTDPFHGEVRIKEFKQMVQALHKNGIRVVMDVVYNHVFDAEEFCYQKIVPDYFFRKDKDKFADGSACGNETASNHLMVRKYMIDSLCYWAKEYHIDGFRFDLMAIHDIITMNEIRKALNEIDENIIIYGEGWAAEAPLLPEEECALKKYTYQMPGIAAFSDDLRDAVKGSVFEELEKGFVSGEPDLEELIQFGVTGATGHSSLYRKDVVYKQEIPEPWAASPSQCVNYSSCHDNYTLWDKLVVSNQDKTKEEIIAMNKLAAAILFTSQGIPFIHAGEEILRSKPDESSEYGYQENSFKSNDKVNSIKWNTKKENIDMFQYYQGLIAFRKATESLRLKSKEEVEEAIEFFPIQPGVVSYVINTKKETLFIAYNANEKDITLQLPEGEFEVYVNKKQSGTKPLSKEKGTIQVEGVSAIVLKKRD